MPEILLYGVIGDAADKLDAATVCPAIRGSSGPLAVRINSPGGYVMEGLAIVEAIRSYPGPVTIYVDGLAASMASVIACSGPEAIIAESALLMVHKPWDASIGNADELRADAAKLDRIEQQIIGIYAKRTGLSANRLARMLAAETWFTPAEAMAAGFVTSIGAPLKLAAMADVSAFGFRHAPDSLAPKDATMTTPNSTTTPPADTTQAATLERTRVTTIMSLCDRHHLPVAMRDRMIADGTALDAAREIIIDALATRDEATHIGNLGAALAAGAGGAASLDNPATYSDAVRDALMAKIAGRAAEGPAAHFRGMSVVDIARDYLGRAGNREASRMSPDRVINAAMQARGQGGGFLSGFLGSAYGGGHTTTDFPDLVGGAAEKFLIERYKVQESQLKLLARQRDRNNFLMQYGVQTSGFGTLDKVPEGGEFANKSLTTRKEGYALETWGNIFAVSRQMLINDALGALADVLSIMAAAATEMEAQVLADLINGNVRMADGKAWFHADHGNLAAAGGAPSIATLDAGRTAMRSQKDLDGVRLIDAKPKYLLVPIQLETSAEVPVASTIAPTNTAEVNPFAGKLAPIADPRITSAAAWYLFADPAFSPALQYSYLEGQPHPFLDTEDGWRVDGTEFKVRHDFGAGVLDAKMAWKNPGAPA